MARYRETTSHTFEIMNPNIANLADDLPDYEYGTDVEAELEWEEEDDETNGGGYWTLVSYKVLSDANWVTDEMVEMAVYENSEYINR